MLQMPLLQLIVPPSWKNDPCNLVPQMHAGEQLLPLLQLQNEHDGDGEGDTPLTTPLHYIRQWEDMIELVYVV